MLTLGDDLGLDVLLEGDPLLLNVISVLPVNPATVPGVRGEAAAQFVAWLLGDEAQTADLRVRRRPVRPAALLPSRARLVTHADGADGPSAARAMTASARLMTLPPRPSTSLVSVSSDRSPTHLARSLEEDS